MKASTVALVVASLLTTPSCGQVIFNQASNASTSSAPSHAAPQLEYKFTKFEYTHSTSTYRYAQPAASPTTTSKYAKPYSELSHLLGNVSTTTWGNWDPHAPPHSKPTDTSDPYGQAAWTQLWESANIQNFTRGMYSTTVKPTPVPSKDLVMPPSDPFYFPNGNLTFPEDFVFGVAGSAAQIEGAVADEGRGPTVQEKLISDNRPKDYVTNENYYLYKQDIARLAAMGVKYYSFTIPWSRIMPFAVPGSPVNKQALAHYDDLINTVLDHGLKPMVTMTHFDSPLTFVGDSESVTSTAEYDFTTQSGGYANDTFVDAFVNYGKILLMHYADRVPIWVGFNEPYMYAGNAQGIKHVIQAHSRLYHFYHNEIKGKGKFGIKLSNNFGMPMDPKNESDMAATQRFQDFQLGAIGNPLFLGKDYPESFKKTFEDSKLNFTLSDDDLKLAANSSDFFGIDPYTVTIITAPEGGVEECAKNTSHPLWPECAVEGQMEETGWKMGYRSQSYVYITPTYFRTFLSYLWNTFKAPVFVTEFGFPSYKEGDKELGDQLFDTDRSIYYQSYMTSILEAMHYDHVHILGATAWSFADNWEFGDYAQQFGLQVVNRTTQERHFKKSFFDLVDFVRQRSPYY